MKRFLRPEAVLFLGLWLLLLVGGRSRFFLDPGTFWHTVVGEQILTTRGFFDADGFTFTHAGDTWIPHQWLGEVVMALTHRVARLDSLLLLTATLLAALYTWLGVRLLRAGFHWSVAAVLVASAMAASTGHFHVRPHLATIVCFAVTMAFLSDFEAGRIGVGRLTLLVPLFAVWTNTHGGMLGGLATFGLALAGWFVAWRARGASPLRSWRDCVRVSLVLAGCAATAFVNPYGVRLPLTWLSIYDSDILPQIIKEHSRLNPSEWTGLVTLLFGAFYVVMLAGIWPTRPRVTWLLPLVWLLLACLRVRHAPLFAVAALVTLPDFFPYTRWADRLLSSGSDWFAPGEASSGESPRRGGVVLPALAVAGALAMQAVGLAVPVVGVGWARLDRTVWPVGLLDELRAHEHDRSEGTPIFNEYIYGGFLIYHTPGYRVFVDDRCELFGDAWLNDFVDAEWSDTAGHIQRWQEHYGRFNLALVQNGSGFAWFFGLSSDWVEVGQCESATLYRRRGP